MSFDLWLEYAMRFAHLVAGIAWIGSSFYFIWLDSSFTSPESPRKNVDGELFMVHGGFYYQVEKRRIYPGEIPKSLHWFKWEATLTWITGLLLFAYLYYLRGAGLLIDPQVRALSQGQAIAASLVILLFSWLIYDHLIWNPRFTGAKGVRALGSALLFAGLVFGLTRIFSGRGAFMLTGVVMGTMMVLNVWIRILPGQEKMLKEAREGRIPDYSASAKAKIRSVHNTYFIFPVLFIMLSNHFPAVYSHPQNWLLLLILALSGALTRHAMVTKRPMERWTLLPAASGLAALVLMTANLSHPGGAGGTVDFAQVRGIVQARCLACHSTTNTDLDYKLPPRGIVFETEEQLRALADKVQLHVVLAKSMPLGNKTQMTAEERDIIARWLRQQGLVQTP